MDSDIAALSSLTLPIGAGTDAAAFDPQTTLVFSSNREGTLSVIAEASADDFVPLPTVTTEFGARTMALDPESGRIYLVTADFTANPKATHPIRGTVILLRPGSVEALVSGSDGRPTLTSVNPASGICFGR